MLHNVHERVLDVPAEAVGPLVDGLGRPGDRLWPGATWMPMLLDRPVAVGARGGHGGIRYEVVEHAPGRRVRLDFDPACGLDGFHELSVEPLGPDRCRMRHVLRCETSGSMRVLVPLVVERLHDAVLEDLLDAAERETTGSLPRPSRWSAWVSFWVLLTERPRVRPVEVPHGLVTDVEKRWDAVDLRDAWAVRSWPGLPTDPQVWADAVFRDPPRWVGALIGLRQLLVPLVGIERGTTSSFGTLDRTDDEVLLGEDAGHLDFRAGVTVTATHVVLSTVARATNRRGRAYLAVVRRVHPVVVRAMLSRARRRLGQQARRAGTAPVGGAP